MEKQTFNTVIDASPEQVWKVLFGEKTYTEWTSVFAEGSTAQTDWNEGSRAVFLDGNNQGMVAKIAKNIPNKFLSIQHLGIIKDGKEDLESDEVKKWAGCHENYTLNTINGKTELIIDMEVTEDYKDYFLKVWPLALNKVKDIAEHQLVNR